MELLKKDKDEMLNLLSFNSSLNDKPSSAADGLPTPPHSQAEELLNTNKTDNFDLNRIVRLCGTGLRTQKHYYKQ